MKHIENIAETLQSIIRYYETNRGVGHTYVQLNGITNISGSRPQTLVVVNTYDHGVIVIPRSTNTRLVRVDQIPNELRGRAGHPLVIEHLALAGILTEAFFEIQNWKKAYDNVLRDSLVLGGERDELKKQVAALKSAIHALTKDEEKENGTD